MDLTVRMDKRGLADFEDAMAKQVPFATARALTKTAAQAKEEIQKELPKSFVLRNKFTAGSIRHQRAEKKDWPHPMAKVGSISPYMALQAEGGNKVPPSKAFAIPKGIRKSEKRLVPRAKWPGKILADAHGTIPMGGRPAGARNGQRSKAKPFLMREQGGVGVYVRTRRGRGLTRLYRLTRETMHVKPRDWLEGPVIRTCNANLEKNFAEALTKAMQPRA